MTGNEPVDSEDKCRKASPVVTFARIAFGRIILAAAMTPARASPEHDARIKQMRLLCMQLSGDLTEPEGMMQFKRCMSQDPATAIKQNAGLALISIEHSSGE